MGTGTLREPQGDVGNRLRCRPDHRRSRRITAGTRQLRDEHLEQSSRRRSTRMGRRPRCSSSSANPSVYGQAVTFTATVQSHNRQEAGRQPGSLTFSDGTTPLGTGDMLDASTATYLRTTAHSSCAWGAVSRSRRSTAATATSTSSTSTVLTQTVRKDSTTTVVVILDQSIGLWPIDDLHGNGGGELTAAAVHRRGGSPSETAPRLWVRVRSAMAARPPSRRPLAS